MVNVWKWIIRVWNEVLILWHWNVNEKTHFFARNKCKISLIVFVSITDYDIIRYVYRLICIQFDHVVFIQNDFFFSNWRRKNIHHSYLLPNRLNSRYWTWAKRCIWLFGKPPNANIIHSQEHGKCPVVQFRHRSQIY